MGRMFGQAPGAHWWKALPAVSHAERVISVPRCGRSAPFAPYRIARQLFLPSADRLAHGRPRRRACTLIQVKTRHRLRSPSAHSHSRPSLDFIASKDYHFTMTITIDKLGRVVIPKKIRDRFHLVAGSEMELEPLADGGRLRVFAGEPALGLKRGILVHHGSGKADTNVVAFIQKEREARSLAQVSERDGR